MPKRTITDAELEDIKYRAFNVLNGAETMRQRLLHALSLGNPSLEDEAYAIKSRVKSYTSLVNKVVSKRLNDRDKNDYVPESATDIIGFRFLTLFRKELPTIIGSFINFVDWAQKAPFNLFYGSNLQDAIAEIIIYSRAQKTDPTLDLCLSEFAAYGLYETDKIRAIPSLPHYPVKFRIDEKNSKYSSIHIVLNAVNISNGIERRFPVEVQIRTGRNEGV